MFAACQRNVVKEIPSLAVTSPAFADGAAIPERYTCEGDNLSPPLAWSGVPKAARSIAIVVDDPDAPRATFFHWVVLGIAPTATKIDEGRLPAGAHLVQTSSEDVGYTGMCPPNGDPPHHYRFKVYALKSALSLPPKSNPGEAAQSIAADALGAGFITGTFKR